MTALPKHWTASEIIARAEAKGVSITAEGDKIKLVPSSAVTLQMRRVVLEYKPILLQHFAALPVAPSGDEGALFDYQGMSYEEWLASLVLDPPLCLTCLDTTGQEREALPDDYQGFMYCYAHHPGKGYQLLTTPAEIRAFVLLPGRYVLDLETTGLLPEQQKIISIAFGRPGAVCIIDVRAY